MVGAKLLGILYFFWAISIVPQILVGYGSIFINSPQDGDAGKLWPWFIGNIFVLGLNLSIGFILLFRTEKVSKFLKIPEEHFQADAIFSEFTQIGIVLIGVYSFANGFPEFLKFSPEIITVGLSSFTVGRVISSFAKVVLGIWFIFSSRKIVNFIGKNGSEKT